MKRVIFILMLFVGMTGSSYAQDTRSAIQEDAQRDAVFTEFMKAQLSNDVPKLRKLIAKDATVLIPGKTGLTKVGRDEYLAFLRISAVEQQNCYPAYEIIKVSENMASARVDFTYTSYVIQYYLKSEKAGNNWKISELRKVMPEDPEPVIVRQQ